MLQIQPLLKMPQQKHMLMQQLVAERQEALILKYNLMMVDHSVVTLD